MRFSLAYLAVPILFASRLYSQDSMAKVCEERAFKVFQSIYYGPRYRVLNNVTYSKQKGKRSNSPMLGELDVIVLEGRRLIAVAEVKYAKTKKNLIKSKKKGISQMRRFSMLCLRRRCDFWSGKEKLRVEVPQNPNQVKISLVSYFDQRMDEYKEEKLFTPICRQ